MNEWMNYRKSISYADHVRIALKFAKKLVKSVNLNTFIDSVSLVYLF